MRTFVMCVLTAAAVSFCANTFAADNELTAQEKEQGWLLLFNGKDLNDWKNNSGKPISPKAIDDGCIQTHDCGGYILVYDKPFGNFTLKCDVKMSEKCNSGIFTRIENLKDPVNTGFEIQVADSKGEPNANSNGALYDVKPASENPANGVGNWDTYEVTFNGPKVIVKINGKEIVTADLDSYTEPGKRDVPGDHKYKLDGKARALKDFARSGYLGFQDHGHDVWIKNVKLLPLDK
ncbi:hypothetical protein FACS189427_10120 [Planctomycetales bacterium]|nr:hypothetical protein FACS189427_10120 [Planctomycetales bacterium]